MHNLRAGHMFQEKMNEKARAALSQFPPQLSSTPYRNSLLNPMLPQRQDSLSQLEPSSLKSSSLEPSALAKAVVQTKQNLNLQLREISTSASASTQREPKKTLSLLPERYDDASASACSRKPKSSTDTKQELWDRWRSTTRNMATLLSLPAPRNLPSTSHLVRLITISFFWIFILESERQIEN